MSAPKTETALSRMLGRAPRDAEIAMAEDQARRLEDGIHAHPLTLPPSYGSLRLVRANDLLRDDPFAPLPPTEGVCHDE